MNVINDERKRARLTVNELCEMIGISKAAYYRKVNGQSEFTLREIEALCRALKIRPSIFF